MSADELAPEAVAPDEVFAPNEQPPPAADATPRSEPCPQCGQTFVNASGLRRHLTRTHGEPSASWRGAPEREPGGGVTVQLGGGPAGRVAKDDPALAQVETRATQLAQSVAAILLLAGQQADAADIGRGAEGWAKSVRHVAEYEEWLRKLAAGGETTGRAMAWVELAVATATLALPILMRHGALPEQLAAGLGALVANAPDAPPASSPPPPEPPVDESRAA